MPVVVIATATTAVAAPRSLLFVAVFAIALLRQGGSVVAAAAIAIDGPSSSSSPDSSGGGGECTRRAALIGAGAGVAACGTASFAGSAGAYDTDGIAAAVAIPTWRLDGGVEFPILALNTAGLPSRDVVARAVRNAFDAGIRHVEFHPGIERDGVASVLRSQQQQRRGVDRKNSRSVFLTTKIETRWETKPTPKEAASFVKDRLDEDLAALNVEAIDMLMLRESPDPEVVRTMWRAMEDELEAGRVRSLGVANHCPLALKRLLSSTKLRYKPQVNYIQLHVGMGPMPPARAYGESRGIRTFAYGHLGERARPADDTRRILSDPTLNEIALDHHHRDRDGDDVKAEDVALRWVLDRGAAASVRPTSDFELGKGCCVDPSCSDGLRASVRTAAGRWGRLTPSELRRIDALRDPDSDPTLFSSPGCPGSFFG